nr:metallophosphoesterase [uncultured Holophaga sp.]
MSLPWRSALVPTLVLSALIGCGGSHSSTASAGRASFAVLSDTHLHDGADLGASGSDFAAYLAGDRKMIAESEEILDVALGDIETQKPDFLMISGDLTKDGEQVNHLLMSYKLSELRGQGIKVLVIPGNHDIYNPDAVSYLSSPPTAVANVSPDEFKQIYQDCGYGEALYQDSSSLSYVAEPVQGLWVFCLDTAEYDDNLANGSPTTAGRLSAATQTWVLNLLQEAKAKGKTVIGMMHHGIVEHYSGQATLFPEYLITDYATVGKTLADAGLKVIFTGHFHANDISTADFSSSQLYDCETGSLVTAPSPYRYATADLDKKTLAITTSTVTSIPSHPTDFVSYANTFVQEGLYNLAVAQFEASPYSLDAGTAQYVASLLAPAMMAHYAGDESLTDATTTAEINAMVASTDATTQTLGYALLSLWTDKAPADNQVTIPLQ